MMRILKTSSALTSALITSLLAAVPQIALAAEGDGIIDPGEDEIAELAKATQNPISSLISLPLQNNTDFNFGPNNETRNVLNVQPVWPISLNDDWNLITRTILPVISQPGLFPGQSRETGLGDTVFTAFFSPNDSGKLVWGVGPAVLIPTSTDDRLGVDEWGLGPSVVLLTMPGNWVIGSLFSNVWGINEDAGNEVNLFTWQYFINYNLDDGWFLTSAPIITANWEAPSGQKWTVPVGGGFGRVFRIGKQPINANIHYYYDLEHPDFVGNYSLRLTLQFMFPKSQ